MNERSDHEPSALDHVLRGALPLTRRGFLAFGTLAAVGCATGAQRSARLPDPQVPIGGGAASCPPVIRKPKEYNFVMDRELWCKGECVPALMNPMLPPRYVTVHHDGMSPFLAKDQASCAARIEIIRNGHRSKGWGDIGYHYVVDRGGRVWEGRELKWQGAHVKNCNENNLGICCLGNFDEQSPSDEQLEALERMLGCVMQRYRIPVARVRTHQEWPSARTACPGRALQREMVSMRARQLASLPMPAGGESALA